MANSFSVYAKTLNYIQSKNANENEDFFRIHRVWANTQNFTIRLNYDDEQREGQIKCSGVAAKDFCIDFMLPENIPPPSANLNANNNSVRENSHMQYEVSTTKGRLPQLFYEASGNPTGAGAGAITTVLEDATMLKGYQMYTYEFVFNPNTKMVRVDTEDNLPFWLEFKLP